MEKVYALVKRGICVNTIIATDEFAQALQGYDAIVDCTNRTVYGIGQFWTGTEFIPMDKAIEEGLL